jgi:hypothetical protein
MSTNDHDPTPPHGQPAGASAGDYSSWRLPMCFATAFVVTGIAWHVAWRATSVFELSHSPQTITWRIMNKIRDSVERYRQEKGKLPDDLSDVDVVKDKEVPVNGKKQPIDIWGDPIHYQVDGMNLTLVSYGRDGKQGGEGYDADLRTDQEPEFVKITLWEFTTASRTTGMKVCCVLGGLLAFPLCLMQSRSSASRRSLITLLGGFTITAIFATFVAAVMSMVHFPTGH